MDSFLVLLPFLCCYTHLASCVVGLDFLWKKLTTWIESSTHMHTSTYPHKQMELLELQDSHLLDTSIPMYSETIRDWSWFFFGSVVFSVDSVVCMNYLQLIFENFSLGIIHPDFSWSCFSTVTQRNSYTNIYIHQVVPSLPSFLHWELLDKMILSTTVLENVTERESFSTMDFTHLNLPLWKTWINSLSLCACHIHLSVFTLGLKYTFTIPVQTSIYILDCI